MAAGTSPTTQADDAATRAEAEAKRRLRHRNIAIAVVLAALVLVFYLITLHKGVPILRRPL